MKYHAINNKLFTIKPTTLAVATIMCALTTPAMAQQEVTKLQAVTSYGQQDASQQRQQSPTNAIIVDQSTIEAFNDQTAGDVLRRLPGVTFGGAPGENKDVRIRGLDKEYSQILINGRRIPGGGEKREFQLDQLSASLIERIEIIRAPTADMDAQGIAGTINIILKSIPNTGTGTFSVGTSQIQDGDLKPSLSVSYGARDDDFGYLLSINAQQRQLIKNKKKQSLKSDGSVDKTETETEQKDFDQLQFSPKFDWAISAQDTLKLEPLLLRSDEDKTKQKLKFKADGKADGQELEDESKRRTNIALYGEWQHRYVAGGELTLGLDLQESSEDKTKAKQAFKGDGALDKIENEIEDKSDQQWSFALKSKNFIGQQHALVTGLEYSAKDREKNKNKTETKKGKTKNKSSKKDRYNIAEQRFNAYIYDEYSLSERHLLTPGLRFEWTNTQINNIDGTTRENSDAFWSPSLHYLFTWAEQTNIRASFTSTVRRPKFDDLLDYVESADGTFNKPDKLGNPDLLPEKSNGFDVGIEHYFANRAGNIAVNLFYRDISDKIENRLSVDPLSSRYQQTPENVGDATLKGLEIDSRWNLAAAGLANVTLTGNLTLLDGEITDQTTGLKTPFKEQPDYVYNLGFDHKLTAINTSWGLNLNNISSLSSDEIKDGKRTVKTIDGKKFLDLYIKKSFGNGYELKFSAQNLLKADKNKLSSSYKTDGSVDKMERELEQSSQMFNLTFSGSW